MSSQVKGTPALINPTRPMKRKARMPRTQANYESLVALVQRILSVTASGTGGRKKILGIRRMILDWKVPDRSEIISPQTHAVGEPEDLNPQRKKKAPPTKKGDRFKKKGPPKRQVSKGGIILPGDPHFDAQAGGEEPPTPG